MYTFTEPAVESVKFCASDSAIDPVVGEVLASEQQALLLGAADVGAFAAAYGEQHSALSLRHQAAFLEMKCKLNPASKAECIAALSSCPGSVPSSYKECKVVLDCLSDVFKNPSAVEAFRAKCAELYPHADCFRIPVTNGTDSAPS